VNVCTLVNIPLTGQALRTGGPATFMLAWWPVSLLVTCCALSIAELVSGLPLMGGLYQYASHLGGPKWGPFFAWNAAWLSYASNIAGMANSCQAAARTIILMGMLNSTWEPGPEESRGATYGFYVAVIFLVGTVNIFGERWLPAISIWSTYFIIAGTILIAIWPLVVAPTLQPASFVFLHFENQTGWKSNVLVGILGIVPPVWNLAGFDASSYVAEETIGASTGPSWSLVFTCAAGSLVGFLRRLRVTPKFLDSF
jgi:amino acid transporter